MKDIKLCLVAGVQEGKKPIGQEIKKLVWSKNKKINTYKCMCVCAYVYIYVYILSYMYFLLAFGLFCRCD